MKVTIEELFAVQVMLARQILDTCDLLHSTIELQDAMGKVLAIKLPDMTPEERQNMQNVHTRSESMLEHLEAHTKTFRGSFEKYVKRVEDDSNPPA